jgi:hypothetical protein
MERIEAFREDIMAPLGWADLGDSAILQILRYLLGRGLYDDDVEELGAALKQRPALIDDAFALIKLTMDAFASIHITSATILPYSIQFVLTATALHTNNITELDPRRGQRLWYWTIATGLSAHFTGITANQLREAQQHLANTLAPICFVRSKQNQTYLMPLLSKFFDADLSISTRFDWRAARCRAFVLMLVDQSKSQRAQYLDALARHRRAVVQRRPPFPGDNLTIIQFAKLDKNNTPRPADEIKITLENFDKHYERWLHECDKAAEDYQAKLTTLRLQVYNYNEAPNEE